MSVLRSLVKMVRPMRGAPRWPYVVPALVTFLFIGNATEDAGSAAGALLGGFIAFCIVQAIWPTILGWVILFAPFLGLGIMVALSPRSGSVGEWVAFMAFGFGPAFLLWLGRPWRAVGLRNV
jgi:hypothetical protein